MAKRPLLEKVKQAVSRAGAPVAARLPARLVEGAARAVRTVDSLQSRLTGRGARTAAAEKPVPEETRAPAAAATPAPEKAREETEVAARPARVNAPGRAPRSPGITRASPDGRRAERGRTGTRAEASQAPAPDEEKVAGTSRTSGRKAAGTRAPSAPRRVRKPRPEFKAKRGQKHRH